MYFDEKGKLNVVELAIDFSKREIFKHMRMNVETGRTYFYKDQGYYEEVSENFIHKLIYQESIKDGNILNHTQVSSLFKQLELILGAEKGDVEKDLNYVNFKNGLFNLKEGKLIPHTPEIFTLDQLSYEYREDFVIDNFMDYLDSFTEGNKELIQFLRAWTNLLFRFEYIYFYINIIKQIILNIRK